MKRLAIILAIVLIACTGVFFYRRSKSHSASASASASAVPPTTSSATPAAAKPGDAKAASAKSAATKAASKTTKARGETRDLRMGLFQFSVPVDWMQTNTAAHREVAFGTRDGRLGVSLVLVPADKAKAFLTAHVQHPLPEMTASLDPALTSRKKVNGLSVIQTGGTVGYSGGKRYPARFWVYRGRGALLVINAFDGVGAYRKSINAMVSSVHEVGKSHPTATASTPGSPFSFMERRFVSLRAHL